MPVVVPEENPGQSATGHCLPGCARGGFLGGMPRDLARRERGYANEAVHRASNASEELASGREVGKTQRSI